MDPEGTPIDGPSTSHHSHPPSIDNLRAANKSKLNGTEDESGGGNDYQNEQGHLVINSSGEGCSLEGKSDGGESKMSGPSHLMDQSMNNNDSQNQGNVGKPCPAFGCSKTFSSAKEVEAHMLGHQKKELLCRDCGKPFRVQFDLRRHYRSHSGEKPFECGKCRQKCVSKGNLKAHELTHNPEKKYKCSECGKTFGQERYLKRHELTHTLPYECDVCNTRFAVKPSLTAHQNKRSH